MLLHIDNKSTIHTTENPTFHKRTKNIEIDGHLTWEKHEDKNGESIFMSYQPASRFDDETSWKIQNSVYIIRWTSDKYTLA